MMMKEKLTGVTYRAMRFTPANKYKLLLHKLYTAHWTVENLCFVQCLYLFLGWSTLPWLEENLLLLFYIYKKLK